MPIDMPPLPQTVRVGYRAYRIEPMSPLDATGRDIFGECDSCQGLIRIRVDLDAAKAANTLLHEVLHACWYVGNLDDEDKQERLVRTFANQLSQVWRDNPELVAWLNAGLHQ